MAHLPPPLPEVSWLMRGKKGKIDCGSVKPSVTPGCRCETSVVMVARPKTRPLRRAQAGVGKGIHWRGMGSAMCGGQAGWLAGTIVGGSCGRTRVLAILTSHWGLHRPPQGGLAEFLCNPANPECNTVSPGEKKNSLQMTPLGRTDSHPNHPHHPTTEPCPAPQHTHTPFSTQAPRRCTTTATTNPRAAPQN